MAQQDIDTSKTLEDSINFWESPNVAEDLSEGELDSLAASLIEKIEEDDDSRKEWIEQCEDYLKLASQVKENKSFPWSGASNVKFPLLTIATLQFQARASKGLLGTNPLVKAKKIGGDPDGSKALRGNAISVHMSYQLREQIVDWEDEMDRLCLVIPICGNAFKKTYFNGNQPVSEVILPQDLIINYYARTLDSASRITHVVPRTKNELVSKIRRGEYVEFDLDDSPEPEGEAFDKYTAHDKTTKMQKPQNQGDDTPYTIYECHTFLDLDKDGYAEPVIVTILKEARKVIRIVPRFDFGNAEINDKEQIVEIKPDLYFTNFMFIPNATSGVYGLGFGALLGPINDTVNTLINQLVDSGTLANMPSGFLSKGLRIQQGRMEFRPGEWKHVNSIGDDLRKGIFPLPIKEPSNVLFSLLGLMVEAGQQVASVTKNMLGENPGQNQPFSTTSSMLEQGLMVYASIYRRLYRALAKEYKKLYNLNARYLDPEEVIDIIDPRTEQDMQITSEIYRLGDNDVVPAADPEIISSAQNLAKAEALFAMIQVGTVNPQEATKRILEAQGQENIPLLMQMPPPQPNFDQENEKRKLDIEEQRVMREAAVNEIKANYQSARDEMAAYKTYMEAMLMEANAELDRAKEAHKQSMDDFKAEIEAYKAETDRMKAEKEQNKPDASS